MSISEDLKNYSDDQLATWQAGWKKDNHNYILAENEWRRRWNESKNLATQNQTPDKTTDTTKSIHNPRERMLKVIAVGVAIIILGACVIWVIDHYFGLDLR